MAENKNKKILKKTVVTNKPSPKTFQERIKAFQTFFHDLIDIKVGMDQRGSIRNISNNKEMKGANAWLLMCSIMVASLGLDLNSPAVIIGAMLISPLMSPILGIGLGVAVNNRETLAISLKHFGLSIIIALFTSYVYFSLTPFGALTKEIEARTAPNLLDGLVAIFGGLAGIISMTRKDKSNAIPGVAIATALMPPLCVAGFGLAKGEWSFFRNAFYLFFLNSFFISLSTYIVIRFLGFRYKEYPNEMERRRNQIFIAVFSIIILIPAINLLLNARSNFNEKKIIRKHIKEQFENDYTAITDWDINRTDSILELDIQFIGEPVERDSINACNLALEAKLGKPIRITTFQSKEIPFDDIQKLKRDIGGFQGEFAQKIANLEKIQQERALKIEQLTSELDSIQSELPLRDIFEEAKINYPLIEEIGYSEGFQKTNFSNQTRIPALMLKWNGKKRARDKAADEKKLLQFVRKRIKLDTLILLTY